jgi:hypothetical protein
LPDVSFNFSRASITVKLKKERSPSSPSATIKIMGENNPKPHASKGTDRQGNLKLNVFSLITILSLDHAHNKYCVPLWAFDS